ncbi:hypothetical protein RUM43_008093 [Polyplax serrata]|uniref:PX domain-containing protein n=1 Tax=Polyplax serrata TaxID=468196 RepID=A0AAN8PN16_POLSC
MAESVECDNSDNLETDKTDSLITEKTLSLDGITVTSLSQEGSVVASPSIESFSTLPEAEGSLNFSDESPDLVVRIDTPEKHFDLLDTYITFKVTTKTTRPEFKLNSYSVKRRYNDFAWLRQNLISEYPTHIVPPIPVKHSLIEQLDRYGKEFVTTRMNGLQTFLTRLVKHPILSCSTSFTVFLTANNEEFQYHKKVTAGGLFSKISDSINNLSTMYIEARRSPELNKLNEYLTILPEKLSHLCKISQRIYKERTEEAADLAELKSVFQYWAGSESDLTDPLCEMASAIDKVRQSVESELLNTENLFLFQPIKDYLLYIVAIKETLERRDNVEINYLHQLDNLEKKKQEKEELEAEGNDYSLLTSWAKSSAETKSERLEKLNQVIPQYQQQVEEARDKLEIANENIRSDLERWNQERKNDLKNILITFADMHINHYERCLRAWNEVDIQNPETSRPVSRKSIPTQKSQNS